MSGHAAKSPRSALLVPLVVGLLGWGAAAYVWIDLQDVRAEIGIA